jgi:hypothetical protein
LSSAADPSGVTYNSATNTWTIAPAALGDLMLKAGEATTTNLTVMATNMLGETAASNFEQRLETLAFFSVPLARRQSVIERVEVGRGFDADPKPPK